MKEKEGGEGKMLETKIRKAEEKLLLLLLRRRESVEKATVEKTSHDVTCDGRADIRLPTEKEYMRNRLYNRQ